MFNVHRNAKTEKDVSDNKLIKWKRILGWKLVYYIDVKSQPEKNENQCRQNNTYTHYTRQFR